MQENTPVREIKIIINGTCNAPKYKILKEKLSDSYAPITYDPIFDSIIKAYIPNINTHESIYILANEISELEAAKKDAKQHQKKAKGKTREDITADINTIEIDIVNKHRALQQAKNFCKHNNIDQYFDKIGSTTIDNNRVLIGCYRGPGTSADSSKAITDALTGDSMTKRIDHIAHSIYENLLKCIDQEPLPQVNIQGFSRGGYMALAITERLNYFIAKGDDRAEKKLENDLAIKKKKTEDNPDNLQYRTAFENSNNYLKTRSQAVSLLKAKPIHINTTANDPVPGMGCRRSAGVYKFDRLDNNVTNKVFSHQNTGYNKTGFQGESVNQIWSSLSGFNQHQHVQSGYVQHSDLQKIINTNKDIVKTLEKAISQLDSPPEHLHPATIPGLFTIGMWARDVRETYKDDENTINLLFSNLLNEVNKEIVRHNQQHSNNIIPPIQIPTDHDMIKINHIMYLTLQIQKELTTTLVRTQTGGLLQDIVDNGTVEYAHLKACEIFDVNNALNIVPNSYETEKFLSKINEVNSIKKLLAAKWYDTIASSERNIALDDFSNDPQAHFHRNQAFQSTNLIVKPLYNILFNLTTNEEIVDKKLKTRELLKRQIKCTIHSMKKEIAYNLCTYIENLQEKDTDNISTNLRNHLDLMGNLSPQAIIEDRKDIEDAIIFETTMQDIIQGIALTDNTRASTVANDTYIIMKKLDKLYQKVHLTNHIDFYTYKKELQSHLTEAGDFCQEARQHNESLKDIISITTDNLDKIACCTYSSGFINHMISNNISAQRTISTMEPERQKTSTQQHLQRLHDRLQAVKSHLHVEKNQNEYEASINSTLEDIQTHLLALNANTNSLPTDEIISILEKTQNNLLNIVEAQLKDELINFDKQANTLFQDLPKDFQDWLKPSYESMTRGIHDFCSKSSEVIMLPFKGIYMLMKKIAKFCVECLKVIGKLFELEKPYKPVSIAYSPSIRTTSRLDKTNLHPTTIKRNSTSAGLTSKDYPPNKRRKR